MEVIWLAILAQCLRSFALPAALWIMETWLRVHTALLPQPLREDKRDHARAHYFDLVAHLREEGYDPPSIAPYIVLDVLRGLPADVSHLTGSAWRRLGLWLTDWLGRAQFWLAMLAVLAIWGLRRLPRLRSVPEPSTQWPVDWVVFAMCLVMLVLYSGALERVPAEIAKWRPSGNGSDGMVNHEPSLSG